MLDPLSPARGVCIAPCLRDGLAAARALHGTVLDVALSRMHPALQAQVCVRRGLASMGMHTCVHGKVCHAHVHVCMVYMRMRTQYGMAGRLLCCVFYDTHALHVQPQVQVLPCFWAICALTFIETSFHVFPSACLQLQQVLSAQP